MCKNESREELRKDTKKSSVNNLENVSSTWSQPKIISNSIFFSAIY